MPWQKPSTPLRARRTYPGEIRHAAVPTVLYGHSAPSVPERLGLSRREIERLTKSVSRTLARCIS